MRRRTLGRSAVALPQLCLGAMRFDPQRLTVTEGSRLIAAAHARGVDAWHSSAEYETHEHFCASLRAFRRDHPGARVVHLSKIAAPHFEDPGFDPRILRERVEAQLRALDTERLDVVPAQLRVEVTIRPKYVCRGCDGAPAQAPAPGHIVDGGLPTDALVAQVVVSKDRKSTRLNSSHSSVSRMPSSA